MNLAERCKKVMPPMAERVTDLGVIRGAGSYLYTEDNRKILDFASGIAVCNLGHNHPMVTEAAKRQIDKLVHGCHNILYYESYVELAERLVKSTGGDTKVYFSNSGAEANEGALKLAKCVTGRQVILSFKNSFHGRTLACASITASNSAYRKYYEPLMPGVYFAEYPNLFRTPYKMENGECPHEYMDQFDEIFHKIADPFTVAAIILEPVQGEGGYVVPPLKWLQHVRKICDDYGIMLIFDEIQTGFGRTGELFAYQVFDVKPDILTSAKALGGGFPLSAIIAKEEIMNQWPKGAHGGTFGGNPVACAASLASLEVIEKENMLANCKNMGSIFRAGLTKLQAKYPNEIGDVRGIGLMNAIELVKEDKKPDDTMTKRLQEKALERNLLILSCGADKNVIRFIPPLNVSEQEIGQALEIIDEGMKEITK